MCTNLVTVIKFVKYISSAKYKTHQPLISIIFTRIILTPILGFLVRAFTNFTTKLRGSFSDSSLSHGWILGLWSSIDHYMRRIEGSA